MYCILIFHWSDSVRHRQTNRQSCDTVLRRIQTICSGSRLEFLFGPICDLIRDLGITLSWLRKPSRAAAELKRTCMNHARRRSFYRIAWVNDPRAFYFSNCAKEPGVRG